MADTNECDPAPGRPAPAVYKVLRDGEWKSLQDHGLFTGSPDDLRDGFVHLSTVEQLAGTLERHFSKEGPLHLVCLIDLTKDPALKWEKSRDNRYFPHLYRAVTAGDVRWSTTLQPDGQGGHNLEDGLPA